MEEIMQDLDAVFKIISSIPVTGDAIDAIAVARSKLRNAYTKLDEEKKANTVTKEE